MAISNSIPKRYADALAIIEGACNPSGIAHSIIDAQREIYDEGKGTDDVRQDPAVRLMAHQLGSLCGVYELDHDLVAYGDALNACRAKVSGGAPC